MLKGEGKSNFFCVKCKKSISLFVERRKNIRTYTPNKKLFSLFKYNKDEPACPDCGCEELIGLNTNKCPLCIDGVVEIDEDNVVCF